MHKISILWLGLVLAGVQVFAAGAETVPADVIARVHYAGTARISADRNSASVANFFASPEAKALEAQTLEKLSRAPGIWYRNKIAPGGGDGVAQLRPLLDDFLTSEWLFEIREAPGGTLEYTLAIRLDAARAALWQNNLMSLLQSWTGVPAQKIPNGWQLRKHVTPNLFRTTRAGDWVVIGCGDNVLPQMDALFGRLAARQPLVGPEETGWVEANLNWPRLARWFPVLQKFDFPAVAVQIAGGEGYLHVSGKFTLTQALPVLEKWRVPNVIHPPLTSFTAVRGIGPWLARQSWAQPFEIQPPPDEFFIWAMPENAYQLYAAAPVTDANNALAQLNAKLSAYFSAGSKNVFMGQITTELKNNEISWRGIPPFMSPYVRALYEPSGEYLFGGFFPNAPRPQPLPRELTGQLSMPNLVYYHWELTGQQLNNLPRVTQLLLLLTQHRQLEGTSAAEKWLTRIRPALGQSATQVTQTAPNELTFVRSASAGLTAFELIALADWLEAPNFPGCDLRLPPRQPRLGRPVAHPAAVPAAPAKK